MKAPTEEQLRDPAWWDENAPEFTSHIHGTSGLFAKRDFGDWLIWNYRLKYWEKPAFLSCRNEEFIPRPTKPEPEEWVDGLPTEGAECEYDIGNGEYDWCQIKAHRGSGTWITTKTDDRVVRNDLTKFRPLKSEHDRLREELACLLGESMRLSHDFYAGANAILEKFNVTRK